MTVPWSLPLRQFFDLSTNALTRRSQIELAPRPANAKCPIGMRRALDRSENTLLSHVKSADD